MPLLESSDFCPIPLLRNPHLQTIGRLFVRRVPEIAFERERLELDDGDFLDLDSAQGGDSSKVVILSHGLEGSSRNGDVRGMAGVFLAAGWDTVAWNFRGCSGEPNRLAKSYHSGSSDDLAAVVQHLSKKYSRIDFVGFSMGGNITLKYLGECGKKVPSCIGRAVTFSVPCHLASGAVRLGHWSNRIYLTRFLRSLRSKVRQKVLMFPDQVKDVGLDKIQSFREFDEAYTAPLNGFSGAFDYWEKAACLPVLKDIAVPALLVNARNDPFLTPECFPIEVARNSRFFHLEIPDSGGHLGFVRLNPFLSAWSEQRALDFIQAADSASTPSSTEGNTVKS